MAFLERRLVILGGGAIALAGAVAITAQSVQTNAAPMPPAKLQAALGREEEAMGMGVTRKCFWLRIARCKSPGKDRYRGLEAKYVLARFAPYDLGSFLPIRA